MINQVKILWEDDDLLVINKPANLLVHATKAGEPETLNHWLLEKYPTIQKFNWGRPSFAKASEGREGIVHRLDRDTTGALILAKNPTVLQKLQAQFKNHQVKKTYWLITFGSPKKPVGTIKSYLSRNPKDRTKRTVNLLDFGLKPDARLSVTEYQQLDQSSNDGIQTALIEANLKTGRTHQLRAQFKSLDAPILGDPDYTIKPAKRYAEKLGITRQMLHAKRIEFFHPRGGKLVRIVAPLPADFTRALDELNLKDNNNKTSNEGKN